MKKKNLIYNVPEDEIPPPGTIDPPPNPED